MKTKLGNQGQFEGLANGIERKGRLVTHRIANTVTVCLKTGDDPFVKPLFQGSLGNAKQYIRDNFEPTTSMAQVDPIIYQAFFDAKMLPCQQAKAAKA